MPPCAGWRTSGPPPACSSYLTRLPQTYLMRNCAARGGTAFLDLRTAHVIAACQMTALEICYSARSLADLEALTQARPE